MQGVEEERTEVAGGPAKAPRLPGCARSQIAATRYWLIFAAFTLTAILAAVIRWSLAHPFGIHWDEAEYINDVLIDVQRLRHWMLLKAAGRILIASVGRPPAYRLLADPLLALFGPGTALARVISLSGYGLASWYVYRAASLAAGRIAGAFALLIFCLSPEVVTASAFFGTESSLYLATSAMLFYLLRSLSGEAKPSRDWIGLGAAVGLGFLSKTSFLLIGPPALICWWIIARRSKSGDSRFRLPLKAGLLALLIAGPWWFLHARDAMAYAHFARDTIRNSLGPPSIATWISWANSVVQCVIGPALTILICLIVTVFLAGAIGRKKAIFAPVQSSGLWICLCAGVPIVLVQLAGTNHLLRYITPAVIPLAIAIGILAARTLWSLTTGGMAISSVLFASQLCMLVYPVLFPNTAPVNIGFVNGALPWRSLARFDQWDWKPLRAISESCNLQSPKISYLGSGRQLDPPAIQYPWLVAEMPVRLQKLSYPDVTWLWRYEDGALDWQKVMESAAQSDLVVTVPNQVGEVIVREDLDNRYNADFAARLSKDSRFESLYSFRVGRFAPVTVDVFPRRGLVCRR
jgi:4-amino-4-deoxy-L-arabinose transferase-like glycosyltransferase